MKISNSQLYEIIKSICTAILAVAASLLATTSCAVQTNVQKNTQNSSINGEQSQQVDSVTVRPQF